MAEKYANNAVTTLTLSISAAQTTISVASNDGFPIVTTASGDFFYVLIGQELLKVTNNPTTLWTVQRGVQGSVAAIADAGADVYCVVTKQSLEDIQAASGGGTLIGPYAGLPAAGVNGRLYYTTDSVYTFRDTGVVWQALYQNRPVVIPPAVSSLTWLNQGLATASNVNGLIDFQIPANGPANNVRALLKSYTTPFTLEIGIIPRLSTVNFTSCGIAGKNSATAPLVINSIFMNSSGGPTSGGQKMNSVTSFNSDYTGTEGLSPATAPLYLRFTDNGTNRIFQYSSTNGAIFRTTSTHIRTDFTTCNQVGIYADTTSSTTAAGFYVFHWQES